MTAIDRQSVRIAEAARNLTIACNAAQGYHPRQCGGTYGQAASAVKIALACGLAETNKIFFDDARRIADEVYEEVIDNGENVEYNLGVHGIEILEIDTFEDWVPIP